jgi:hypothetical protein
VPAHATSLIITESIGNEGAGGGGVLVDVALGVGDGETLACVGVTAVPVLEAGGCGMGEDVFSAVLEEVGVIEGVNVSATVAGAGDALCDGVAEGSGAGNVVAVCPGEDVLEGTDDGIGGIKAVIEGNGVGEARFASRADSTG